MLLNLLVVVLLFALAFGFVWLAWRSRRIRSLPLRVLAAIPPALLALIFLASGAVTARGFYLASAVRNAPVPDLRVSATPENVARGEHIAKVMCESCHTREGQPPMTGGANLADDVSLPIGEMYPANLTPAGRVADWSDGQILRAIREGIDPAGIALPGMPAQNLRNLSDEDAASVIAYIRSLKPAGTRTPRAQVTPLGLALVGAGVFNVGAPPVTGPVTAPPKATTAEYGKYIVSFSDCRECHGRNLEGGQPPAPLGPNLAMVKAYSQEQFIAAMRTGVNPGGRQIQPPMPWRAIGQMDDVELAAMYKYLTSLP